MSSFLVTPDPHGVRVLVPVGPQDMLRALALALWHRLCLRADKYGNRPSSITHRLAV